MAALLLRTRLSIESLISSLLFEWHDGCHLPLACGVLLLRRYGTLCSVTYYKSVRHHGRQGLDCAVGVAVRKALLELGGVILAQQINLLTQKTPIGEAEHCLSQL